MSAPVSRQTSRFDVLLRELIAFGLVEPVGGEVGHTWQLTPEAQDRLQQIGAPAPPAEALIYFGRRCAACGASVVTRYRQGTFVCDTCSNRSDGDGEPGSAEHDGGVGRAGSMVADERVIA